MDENPPVEDIVEPAVGTAPESARMLYEDDWLAATEVDLEPGAALTLHRDGDRLGYAHASQTLRFVPVSGAAPDERTLRQGEVARLPSGPIQVENSGATEARLLVVTRSSQPAPSEAGDGPGLEGSRGAHELFGTGGTTVHSLTLSAGGSVSLDDAPLELVYVLPAGGTSGIATSGGIRIEGETARRIGPGRVDSLRGRCRISNPGDPVHLLVFRFEE